MPAVNIQKYLEEEDKNGVKIGSWAVQVAPGVAECKVCVPNRKFGFKKGKSELTRHSESELHRQFLKKQE